MNTKAKLLLALLVVMVYACATNPFTGKKTMAFVGNNEIFPMAFQQYSEFLDENKVIKGTTDANRVKTVGEKIRKAAETYLNAIGQKDYLNDYAWEYNLVDDPSVNAWCMPGGKIVFYTGILPICQNDTGIATVMGHEVAHALLNHGQQRMSAGIVQQGLGTTIAIATANKSPETQQIFMTSFGVGSQMFGMLPFSRSHESEADEIGLKLMAIAGYNPDGAVSFWQRMAANSGGNQPPQFMSTHPSSSTRISNLQKQIPIAKQEAAKFGVTFK
ncbi:MAG: M48 family metallopeptidase [Flavobacteriaceae bacterium]